MSASTALLGGFIGAMLVEGVTLLNLRAAWAQKRSSTPQLPRTVLTVDYLVPALFGVLLGTVLAYYLTEGAENLNRFVPVNIGASWPVVAKAGWKVVGPVSPGKTN